MLNIAQSIAIGLSSNSAFTFFNVLHSFLSFAPPEAAMTEEQLGMILKEEYDSAPYGNRLLCVHLFGIRHAAVIAEKDLRVAKIVRTAKLNTTYIGELSKGVNLAEYVVLK